MQYQVPHFLETEQRILGPFTFHKFIVAIGVGGFLFILYYSGIGFVSWLATAIVAGGATLVFMFGSYQGRPLLRVTIDFLKRALHPNRYLWASGEKNETVSEYILRKENLQKFSNQSPKSEQKEKSLSQQIEEMGKMLDK